MKSIILAGNLFAALALPAIAAHRASAAVEAVSRPRIIATTDGEIDDRCSMVRFLLYANEWDIEGIVYSSSKYHWLGHNWDGIEWIERDIDLYASFFDCLRNHAPGFPTPQALKDVTFVGNIDHVGEMEKVTPGSEHIARVLLDDKPGPVYLQAWGGTNTIARALKTIQEQHPQEMDRVSQKAVLFIIQDQDTTFREYIQPNWPKIQALVSHQFGAIAYDWDRRIPKAYHSYFQAPWMRKNILSGHGPLCARYEAHTKRRGRFSKDDFRSEGDSPAFMHQIVNGLGGRTHPSFGGWGGRFVPEPSTENVWKDARDDNDRDKPIWRWAEDFQNDWAARADWCVKPIHEANHNPLPVVNRLAGKEVVWLDAKIGSRVDLSAVGSSDPDGNTLAYHWWHYTGPSEYSEPVVIDGADEANAQFIVPFDNHAKEHHLILVVRDNGSPPLAAYRRVIVRAEGGEDKTPPSTPRGLSASSLDTTRVALQWQPASDADSGVRQYHIYRDGKRIARQRGTQYVDADLREATTYSYRVIAINGGEVKSDGSAEVRVVTRPDITPPTVVDVRGTAGGVTVTFSEPVEPTAAGSVANYSLSGGLRIESAVVERDHRSVRLTTPAAADGERYSIFITNIGDRARAANMLSADTKRDFVYFDRAPLVQVGVPANETTVTLHGKIERAANGALRLGSKRPWRWIGVGSDEQPVTSLEGLMSLTILGWLRPEQLDAGSGGNRIVFNLDYNRAGIDLVHLDDGRMRLAINQWADRSRADSPLEVLTKGKWTFFAVTYDSSKRSDNVCWYIGDDEAPASLRCTRTYVRGPTSTGSGALTVGNYNKTLHSHGTDRQFRGSLRGLMIFGSTTDGSEALDLETIRTYQ